MLARPPADGDDVAVVNKIILKGIHDKKGGLIWTELTCLQLVTGGGLLYCGNKLTVSINL